MTVGSLFRRRKAPGSAPRSSPATDEKALDRNVARLKEIFAELESILKFLAKEPALDSDRFTELERTRVPGFYGYKLAQEAMLLLELIAVCIAVLRVSGTTEAADRSTRRLDEAKQLVDAAEPALRASLKDLEIYQSLDGAQQLEAMARRFREGKGEK